MKYDLAIIGGGPAGYSAAFRAAELGMSAVLFEDRDLGGVCLNRGCVPTKFLAHISEKYHERNRVEDYGLACDNVRLQYDKVVEKKNALVRNLRNGLVKQLQANRIELVCGRAGINGKTSVQCNGALYDAANILIATGSRPAPALVEGAITSDELLSLDYIPKSMTILGGGVIAMEFAEIYRKLGTEIVIAIRGDRILRKWDKELAVSLTQHMKKLGITFETGCDLAHMQSLSGEVILSANGRIPNIGGLAANSLGLEMDETGIFVDEFGRSSIPGIYAAGDVISGSKQLAHVAMDQGIRAVDHIAGNIKQAEIPTTISCIYVSPEIASVGLTENEAKSAGIQTVTGKQNTLSNARSLIASDERGFVKLVADAHTGVLIGAQLMCERASDMAAEAAMAIDHKFTVYEFMQTVHPHPSFCEVLFEAAQNLRRKLT